MGVVKGVREGERVVLGVEQYETGGWWAAADGVRGGSPAAWTVLDDTISGNMKRQECKSSSCGGCQWRRS